MIMYKKKLTIQKNTDLIKPNKKIDYLTKSVSNKPMVFHIIRKEKFTSDLDYLDLDETV